MQIPRRRRSFEFPLLPMLFLLLLRAISPDSRAEAQSPSPFADPLSSADLARWVSRFELSGDAAQRAAAVFEQSLVESQALRDGELASFTRDARPTQDPTVTLEALEQRSKRARALVARQAAIENRLFDELASMLPESRRASLEAERRAAARRRSAAALDMFDRSGLTPDLLDALGGIDGGAALRDQPPIATALLDYDLRLTDLMQRAANLALESGPVTRRAVDAAAAARTPSEPSAGQSDGSPPGPGDGPDASMRDRIRTAMDARAAAQAPLAAIRGDILALHRSAFDRLMTLLPPVEAHALRHRFISSNYRAIAIKRDTPERLLAQVKSKAGGVDGVPAEALESAERVASLWRERTDAIERRMMDAVDDRRLHRGGGMLMPFDDGGEVFVGGSGPADAGPLPALRREREEAAQQARDQIAALHPLLAELSRRDAPGPQIAFGAEGMQMGPGGAGGVVEARATAVMVVDGEGGGDAIAIDFSPDMLQRGGGAVIRPIDPREFDAMVARLGWSGLRREQAQAAFDAYRAKADERVRSALGNAKAEAPLEIGGAGGMAFIALNEPPAPEVIASAVMQLAAEDEAFFEALSEVAETGSPQSAERAVGVDGAVSQAIARERGIRSRERLRQRLSLGGPPMLQPWGRFEKVELAAIATEVQLPDALRAPIEQTVSQHGERMNALLANLASARETLRKAEASATRVIDHGDGRIERSINVDSDGDGDFSRAIRGQAAALEAVTSEVRRTLDDLARQLPHDAARRIRRAAYAQAMPQIVTDPRSAEERLEQAIMLESISEPTRMALIELLASHQDAVDALVDRFVVDAEHQERDGGPRQGPGPGEMRAMRGSDALQRRLRFDRNEVNDATMRRVRALLSAEENAAIADLPSASGAGGVVSFSF